MIRNYFLIAIRTLWRNKVITLINLAGMAMAFGIFLSLWSWVRSDLDFDTFHEDIEQMYILNITLDMSGSEYTSERTGGLFHSLIPEIFPQVRSACRISNMNSFELGVPVSDSLEAEGVPVRYIDEDEIIAVDSVFFHFFSFNLLKGDVGNVFTERDHIVLSESLAEKLFGAEDPMWREIRMGEGGWYRVAGLVEDPPENSTYQFSALVGFHVMEELGFPINGHGGTMYFNNFKLNAGTDIPALNQALNDYVASNYDLDLEAYFFLDKFSRVHLHGESRAISGLYINIIIAVIILLIGCINFINLTTAYSSERIQEIFIRKSAGASKRQLVFQFMGETYLLLAVSLYLGFFVAEHLVPYIFRFFGTSTEADFTGLYFYIQLVLVFLLTGLLAGLYPAIKIAGFRAPAFLTRKGTGKEKSKNISRKVLIVLQFTFSIIFVIVSIFVIKQFNHLKKADLGFNREDVMYIRTTGRVWDKYPQIKTQLSDLHFVSGVTTASNVPVMLNTGELEWGEEEGEHNKIAVILRCDEDFLSTFEIEMMEGRFFYPDADSLNGKYVVVNHSLVELMGWEDPVGRTFYLLENHYTILGVTENIDFFPFNLEVFNDKTLIYRYEDVDNYVFIKTGNGISQENIARIEAIFHEHNPGYEFSCSFVSEYDYDMLDDAEGLRFLFRLFSVVAILIAIMGVIGLSVFNHNRRTREVGIRKAMGAQNGVILRLLLTDFIKLVVLSNILGITASYLIVRKILQFFSYAVEIQASVFVTVFLLSLLLTVLTVSALAFKAARSNPVDSLRYE